ncbi:MAG: MSMEG_0567/Sll0786 family nitrogen starvation N-acetyltransferase [Chloroflexota bacterium]
MAITHIICKIVETQAERQAHFAVRHAVFVEEQGMFAGSDVDEHDRHAIHLVAVEQETGQVVGAVRVYKGEPGIWYGGRMAVLKEYRQHFPPVGPMLDRLAERTVSERGCRRFLAYIQLQNVRFFKRLGWSKVGEPIMYCGQLHQVMEANLAAKLWLNEPHLQPQLAHA